MADTTISRNAEQKLYDALTEALERHSLFEVQSFAYRARNDIGKRSFDWKKSLDDARRHNKNGGSNG